MTANVVAVFPAQACSLKFPVLVEQAAVHKESSGMHQPVEDG